MYNDGTIALFDDTKDDVVALPIAADAHHLTTDPRRPSSLLDDDQALSDGSEGSYGSSRTRTARGPSSLARPIRRTATTATAITHHRNLNPPRPPTSGYGGGGVFKQAAVEVLRMERRYMSTGDIARMALRRGLVRCNGKTPEATMASALYTDIKRKEGSSMFIRPREGMFGLREWLTTSTPSLPKGVGVGGGKEEYQLQQQQQSVVVIHAAPHARRKPKHQYVMVADDDVEEQDVEVEEMEVEEYEEEDRRRYYYAQEGTSDEEHQGSYDTNAFPGGVDRLVELFFAAEQVHRQQQNQEQELPQQEEQPQESGDDGDVGFECHASTTLPCRGPTEVAKTPLAGNGSGTAIEKAQKAEAQQEPTHPEVGRSYVALLRQSIAQWSSLLPSESVSAAQNALSHIDQCLVSASTTPTTTTAPPPAQEQQPCAHHSSIAPLPPSALKALRTNIKGEHRNASSPLGGGGSRLGGGGVPLVTSTPPAVEDARPVTGPFTTTRQRQDDVENCVPSAAPMVAATAF